MLQRLRAIHQRPIHVGFRARVRVCQPRRRLWTARAAQPLRGAPLPRARNDAARNGTPAEWQRRSAAAPAAAPTANASPFHPRNAILQGAAPTRTPRIAAVYHEPTRTSDAGVCSRVRQQWSWMGRRIRRLQHLRPWTTQRRVLQRHRQWRVCYERVPSVRNLRRSSTSTVSAHAATVAVAATVSTVRQHGHMDRKL